MTDRELLELAAKASGIEISTWSNCQAGGFQSQASAGGKFWNPLTDDGDALRLAFALRLNIEFLGGFKQVQAFRNSDANEKRYGLFGIVGYGAGTAREPMLENVRRAIVLAAAEIGRSMP